jgi:hypothetical protein
MAVNMSTMVYQRCQDLFGRPVTFTSTLGNSYSGSARGIYDTEELNVLLEDGSIMSDQKTILDIRAAEFGSLPVQGDIVDIPYDSFSELPDLGSFVVLDTDDNGGGEITLTLRKLLP